MWQRPTFTPAPRLHPSAPPSLQELVLFTRALPREPSVATTSHATASQVLAAQCPTLRPCAHEGIPHEGVDASPPSTGAALTHDSTPPSSPATSPAASPAASLAALVYGLQVLAVAIWGSGHLGQWPFGAAAIWGSGLSLHDRSLSRLSSRDCSLSRLSSRDCFQAHLDNRFDRVERSLAALDVRMTSLERGERQRNAAQLR